MTSVEDVQIRDYRPGDGPGILDLLNTVFAEDDPHFTPRTPAQWSWVYEQNPAGAQIVVAEAPGGRIVGHYACIPYRVVIDGEVATCGQGVDSMVSPEYRRGLKTEGLFLRTARRYFDTWGVPGRNAYGYGFPNRKAFRIGVRMLDYLPVHAPVRTLGRNLFATHDDSIVAGDAGRAYGDDVVPGDVVPGDVVPGEVVPGEVVPGDVVPGEVVPIARFDARADRLWARMRPEIRMGTIRDARFLDWRYLDCPFAKYRAYGLPGPDGEWRGVYVRRDDWTGPPILAVCELLVPAADRAAAARLLAHAVAAARAAGQQRVELWLPPRHPLFAFAEQRGFVAEDSPFNLCIKIYDPRIEPEWVREHWYFGIGDTDVF